MKISFRKSLNEAEAFNFENDNDGLLIWVQLHKLSLQFGWKFRKFERDFSIRKYNNKDTGQEMEGLCQTCIFDTYRFVLFPRNHTKDIFWSIPSKININVPLIIKEAGNNE